MAIRQTFVPQHGMNSQTPAVQHAIRLAVGSAGGVLSSRPTIRRKKKATAASAARATKRGRRTSRNTRKLSSSSAKPARLVKGSAAAKRYMAKLRAKRKA